MTEGFEPTEGLRLTGLFDVHWEDDESDEHDRGPQGVAAHEAIRWAREHAVYVLVRLGEEDQYSAGEPQLPGLPEWPEGGILVRPRPIGGARDGSEQEIDWMVRGTGRGTGLLDASQLETVKERLTGQERLSDVKVEQAGGELVVSCNCFARSMTAAVIEADTLFGAAVEPLQTEHGRPGPAYLEGVSGLGPTDPAHRSQVVTTPWSITTASSPLGKALLRARMRITALRFGR